MESNSGNVLFLILIAVALFAALAYAITSSTGSGGAKISKEQASANAAAIIQYTTAVRNAFSRLKLVNGCTDETIDVSNNFKKNNGLAVQLSNTATPADNRCKVYHPSGGVMSEVTPNPSALLFDAATTAPNVSKPGASLFQVFQISGVGTDGLAGGASNDISIEVSGINKETCIAINNLLGVENPNGEPPVVTWGGAAPAAVYNGASSLSSSQRIMTVPNDIGKPEFCRGPLNVPGAPEYKFMHVMVAR